MSKKVDNPLLDVEVEFEAEPRETSDVTDIEKDEPSLEELATEIERRNTKEPKKAEKLSEETDITDVTVDVTDVTVEDPRFVGKTVEEMVEIYKNVEKLAKAHDTELGKLRKENQEYKDKEQKAENLNLNEIEKQIIPEIKGWTPEQRTEWFEQFNREPEKALKIVTDTLMKPYRRLQAKNTNKEEIMRLKNLHKTHVVPYVEKDINALIGANEQWWKEYKGKIFEHAYDVIRNRDFDKYSAIRQAELKEKERQAEPEEINTFVENNAPARIVKHKGITLDQLRAASPDAAMGAIEKILDARNNK